MEDFIQKLQAIEQNYNDTLKVIDLPQLRARQKLIETELNSVSWENVDAIKSLGQEKAGIEKNINVLAEIAEDIDLARQGFEANDSDIIAHYYDNFESISIKLKKLRRLQLFNLKADNKNCYLEIRPGAGGVDSKDWAQMLLRMYCFYCEKQGWSCSVIECDKNDEGGINSATISISGYLAYGYLKNENGVHRLVRISPFNANAKRQTSFCGISVCPEVREADDIEIKPTDLRIDTFRSSGAGGQHVNTTDSAVRITHIPTAIVAKCQNDRSQLKNRETAMKLLRAKLQQLQDRQEAEKNAVAKDDVSWGSQIRNYVLHPYKIIKDLRSEEKFTNVQDILDGNLGEVIAGVLRAKSK